MNPITRPVTPPAEQTLLDALVTAVRKAGQVNRGVMAAPAAILWPDPDRLWEAALPQLLAALPELMVYGSYRPEVRQGPAIWLKWALAGRDEAFDPGGRTPIVYLPGVGRAQLRAVETCPRELQPLAELQYRGVFFSQASARDWTPVAFLVSRQGGLGLDLAQDHATRQALGLAIAGGVLLPHPLIELQGQRLDASRFQALLTPKPDLALLNWLADPSGFRQPGDEARWEGFRGWCQDRMAFDPASDPAGDGRERLCRAEGPWGEIWLVFTDRSRKLPGLVEKLQQVQPPRVQVDLFGAWDAFARYPAFNAAQEKALAERLAAIGTMSPAEARAAVLEAEALHACRRTWLWRDLGLAPLAVALEALAEVAAGTAQPLAGESPDAQATRYREGGWRVDAAALQAQADAGSSQNRLLVEGVLAAMYTPWLDESARHFQAAVQAAGGLGGRAPVFTATGPGTLTVFVDGLRYDVARLLGDRLEASMNVQLDAAWTCLPSVTASGKPWVSPLKAGVAGRATDTEFQPSVAATGQALGAHHFQKLLTEAGVVCPVGLGLMDVGGQAWIEAGNLDHYGHEFGLQLARDLDKQVADLVERLTDLLDTGWACVRVVTDHGWLLVPGSMPKVELPAHQAETRWGRCATLRETAASTPLTFNWSWCPDVRIAMAPGIGSFRAGAHYAHGGLSIQEMLVPVLTLRPRVSTTVGEIHLTVLWKRLTCHVDAGHPLPGHRVDVRLKPHDPASSVAGGGKPLEGGAVRLLVTEDDHQGATATVVVVDALGEVVHKVATEIGE